MKVKALIMKLQKLDQNLDVYIMEDDDDYGLVGSCIEQLFVTEHSEKRTAPVDEDDVANGEITLSPKDKLFRAVWIL